MELGKKLVKEHPEAGKQGEITLYYTGEYLYFEPTRICCIYVGQQNDNEY